jgi:hypothetical protein
MNNKNTLPALLLLQIIIILLKLVNVSPFSSWNWFAVTAIIWGPVALGILLAMILRLKKTS